VDTRIRAGETPLAARGPLGHTTRGQERPVGGDRLLRPEEAAIRLSILERRRTEVLQTARETTSLQHGIHAVRMTLGGLQKQQESLARMRELAGQASDGERTEVQRYALHETTRQLLGQFDETAGQTAVHWRHLVSSDSGGISWQDVNGELPALPESSAAALGIHDLDLSTPEHAAESVQTLDKAAAQLSEIQADLRAKEEEFVAAIEQRQTAAQPAALAGSRIRDRAAAQQALEQMRNRLLQPGNTAAQMQPNLRGETAARLLNS
jgi:flagellin